MSQRLLLFLIFVFIQLESQSQTLVFADQFSGNDQQNVQTVATDHFGNVFIGSVFYNQMDADPGAGVTQLTAAGSGDVALIKLSSAGNFEWAIQLGETDFETARKVVTDKNGNVIIAGYFHNTIDFDPGPSVYNLTSAGGQDGFIAKYDSSGNFLWAHAIGSSGTEDFYGLAADTAGNVYSVGYFQNTIDFDPGSGITNLTATGGNANFFWKLDKDGNFIWVKQIAYTFANDLALDANANIYVTGGFYGTVDFNPGSGTYNLTASGFGEDAFVMKLDKDGNFQWAGKMSGSSDEAGTSVWYDSATKHILVGGRFEGTVDFDPGNGTTNLTSAGNYDGFVESFTTSGTMVWAKGFGGTSYDEVSALRTDAPGNIHFTGAFDLTCDFDPSNGTSNLTSNGSSDGYLAAWDSSGNLTSVFQIGGALDDWSLQLDVDDEGSIYTCGYFSWTVDFDPGIDTFNLSTFTGWDGFLAKYCTSYTIQKFITICLGDSVFAGGAYQTQSGVYYDYYNPTIGCDSTVITDLTVNHPTVDLGNDTAMCSNQSLLLDAENSGSQFLWSTGATTQTIQISAGGIYSAIVTDAASCVATDTIVVTVNPSPLVNLGSNTSICAGDSIFLDAGNAGSEFIWNSGATTQTIYVSSGGNYAVIVTNEFGCTGSDAIHILLNQLPQVDLGSDTGFCDGDSVLLDAGNPGSQFLWSSGQTTQTIYASSSSSFSVTVTDNNDCQNSDTVNVTVHPLPQISFAYDGDTTVCLSSASFPLPLAYPQGGLYSGDGISENVFNSAIAGVGDHAITYTYTDSLGCTNDSSFVITVVICTGIKLANAAVDVYPNPSNGIIVIERSEPVQETISITDASGKMIRQISIDNSSKATIELGGLAEGIYFLKNENGFVSKIFISQK